MRALYQLGAVAALAVLIPGGAARAGDNERAEFLRAFQTLRDAFKKELPNPRIIELRPGYPVSRSKLAGKAARDMDPNEVRKAASRVKPVKVKPGVTARNGVKVWAELAKDGTKVHLGRYEWKRKEQFYLCFETALPIKVGFFQDYEDRKKVQVLPDKDLPSSYDAVQSGVKFKLPILLEMDDDDDDENVTLVVMGVGTAVEPRLTPDKDKDKDKDKKKRRYGAKSAGDVADEIKKFYERAVRDKMEWQTTARRANLGEGQDPGSRVTSRSTDDVAIIAVGEQNSGYIPLKMKKAR